MEKLKQLKQNIRSNSNSKIIIMVYALLETILNWYCFSHEFAGGNGNIGPFTILSIGTTVFLYYLVDGYKTFISLVYVISRWAKAIAGVLGALTAWMVGLGFLIMLILPWVVQLTAIGAGLLFAYLFPVAFVPLLGGVFRRIEISSGQTVDCAPKPRNAGNFKTNRKKTRAVKTETNQDDVDWDRVYRNVMQDVK